MCADALPVKLLFPFTPRNRADHRYLPFLARAKYRTFTFVARWTHLSNGCRGNAIVWKIGKLRKHRDNSWQL